MISVIAPCFNEMSFAPAWVTNARKLADEIIVYDTGSTDGSYEFLKDKVDKIIRDPLVLANGKRHTWNESKVRTALAAEAKGDWVVTQDLDELLDNDTIVYLQTNLSRVKWYIGRLRHLMFWGDFEHYRVRSLWPPIEIVPPGSQNERGLKRLRLLRNFRAGYPNYIPRIFRNDGNVTYSKALEHTLIQYKNWGRWSYRFSAITVNLPFHFYHYHYVVGKQDGNRDWEKQAERKIRLAKFKGNHPEEARLIKGYV